MLDALLAFFSKITVEETQCLKVTITATTYIPIVAADSEKAKLPIKAIEIKNRSGVDIYVKPNSGDEFPLANGEDRLVYTRSLSRVQLARQSSSGDVTVHIIYEI